MATIEVSDKVAENDRLSDVGMGHECLRPYGDALPVVGQEAASSNDDGEDLPTMSTRRKESSCGLSKTVRFWVTGVSGKHLGMDTTLMGVVSGTDKSAPT
jgi:hypothetical protein